MKKQRCEECLYSSERSDYLCAYAIITGQTRKAQPAEECTFFLPKHTKQKKKTVPPTMAQREAGFRERKPTSRYDWERGRLLYEAGLKDGQIARELGCRIQAVYLWRKKNGLPHNALPGGQRKSTIKK